MEPDALDDAADTGDEAGADDLDPREAARMRRRDHDAAAHERDLMRSGMGKVFKQVTDSWVREPSRPPKSKRRAPGHRPE